MYRLQILFTQSETARRFLFLTLLALLFHPTSSQAGWTPYSTISVDVVSNRVHYSVEDPLRGPGWAPASSASNTLSPAPTNLTNVDGVVAWIQGTGIHYAIYDGRSGFWKEEVASFLGQTVLVLTNRDGVVAWTLETMSGNHTVLGAVYDPGFNDLAGFWRGFNTAAIDVAPAEFLNQDGVVTWLSGTLNRTVEARIYNMEGHFWHGGNASNANPTSGFRIEDGTIRWSDNVAPRRLGYNAVNPAGAFWTTQQNTQPFSHFFPTPSSGDGPLTVAFWDLSIARGAGSAGWSFGDGGTSGEQGVFHTYTGFGEFTASLGVDNGQTDTPPHSSEQSISVTGAPTATPTHTSVPPTATATAPPAPTATNTQPAAPPTATNTGTPMPTATGTSSPSATPTPTHTQASGPTATNTPSPVNTPTLTSTATPVPMTTPSLQDLIDVIAQLREQLLNLEDLLNLILAWQGMPPSPTTTPTSTLVAPTASPTRTLAGAPTPTPTTDPGIGLFLSGDAILDFSVFPNGMTISGVVTQTFTPGTYLVDQFASVGVRFRSTLHPQGAPLSGVGIGVIGGADPANNQVQGVIHAPPLGLDGRTVWEVQFEAPVQRAGIRRGGLVNYNDGFAITNFYNESGGVIDSIQNTEPGVFVSLQVGPGEPGISRIEITSNNHTTFGAGTADDLLFSPVPGFEIPAALRYEP